MAMMLHRQLKNAFRGEKVKIWCISDTHCQHRGLSVPESIDVVIHAGDEATSRNLTQNMIECIDFMDWWENLPIPVKCFSPGNHSLAIQAGYSVPEFTYTHESVDVNGTKAFMSPYTPAWGNSWAYMRKRGRMSEVWDSVPEGIDILVTHGPPKGILDITRDRDSGALIQVGCSALRKRVEAIKPKLHVFGHIHDERGVSNYGKYERDGTVYVNCAVCEQRGGLRHNGIIIDL